MQIQPYQLQWTDLPSNFEPNDDYFIGFIFIGMSNCNGTSITILVTSSWHQQWQSSTKFRGMTGKALKELSSNTQKKEEGAFLLSLVVCHTW